MTEHLHFSVIFFMQYELWYGVSMIVTISAHDEVPDIKGLIVEVDDCRIHVQAQTELTLLTRICKALKRI